MKQILALDLQKFDENAKNQVFKVLTLYVNMIRNEVLLQIKMDIGFDEGSMSIVDPWILTNNTDRTLVQVGYIVHDPETHQNITHIKSLPLKGIRTINLSVKRIKV